MSFGDETYTFACEGDGTEDGSGDFSGVFSAWE